MRNIVLFCSAGMSTSLLVTKMQKYADEINYETNINAYSLSEIEAQAGDADIILLGPQVAFNLESLRERYPDKIVETINMMDYGMMRGDKVIEMVKDKLKD